MSKQTAALKEVNDSRIKIYEQLEVSVTELEKANKALSQESKSDKTKLKRYIFTVKKKRSSLKAKCNEVLIVAN